MKILSSFFKHESIWKDSALSFSKYHVINLGYINV